MNPADQTTIASSAPPCAPALRDTTVITTHINADYDALASMLAAQKLYPEAVVVFPGSQEKNLRNFFVQSMVYLFNMVDLRSVDFDRIQTLVVVDTRQPGRIGDLAGLARQAEVTVHLYDHHPPMPGDLQGDLEVVRQTGATVTLLTEILQQKEIALTADEATILCLGIYEDTGSFNFTSTTAADLQAAAFLLNAGANLDIISNLLNRDFSPEQVGLLNDMLQSATRLNVHGIELLLTSVTTEHFVPDLAFLVHKLIRMENLNAVFALALMENKIHIVARSRIPEVDVGSILAVLGGGGHPYAAAATIKDQTLPQVEHVLVDAIYAQVRSRRLARDLMSTPPITISADVSCREAGQLMTQYNINALVVVDRQPQEDVLLGFITRQIIEKSLYHELGAVPVQEYMFTDVAWVAPEADILEIQDKIIDSKQRILPVMEEGRIRGVVTRTDLLNIIARQSRLNLEQGPDPLKDPLQARTRKIISFMEERLSKRVLELLRRIGEVAHSLNLEAYVVGGFVRDLFLYRKNDDLDIVVEGEGIAFAEKFAALHQARVHTHENFGTAVIIFPDGFKIDVASARMEYYKFPSALPTVEMSSIKLDLFRRDFTMNTLAICLAPRRFGVLIDFFNAQKDIKEKVVRVLHNLSFVEDPTRVFRAIRFEQRFGFGIGKLTVNLIVNAVKMDFFARLSGRRVFNELRHILEEENPIAAMRRMQDFRLLKVVHPQLELNAGRESLLHAVKKVLSWHDLLFLEEPYQRWTVYFMVLIREFNRQTSQEICQRLELAPRYETLFCQDRFQAERHLYWLEKNLPAANSVLCRQLRPLKTELILFIMAATRQEPVKRAISQWFVQLRYIRPLIDGHALKQMGLPPGPQYRKLLDQVEEARLDGLVHTREQELAFVKERVGEV